MFKIVKGVLGLQKDYPKNMTVAQALEWSILKWRFILKHLEKITDESGVDTCALCEKFYGLPGCKGCPVSKATGDGCCVNSPYERMDFKSEDENMEYFVRAEIQFLEDLRPKAGLITIVRKARPGGR